MGMYRCNVASNQNADAGRALNGPAWRGAALSVTFAGRRCKLGPEGGCAKQAVGHPKSGQNQPGQTGIVDGRAAETADVIMRVDLGAMFMQARELPTTALTDRPCRMKSVVSTSIDDGILDDDEWTYMRQCDRLRSEP